MTRVPSRSFEKGRRWEGEPGQGDWAGDGAEDGATASDGLDELAGGVEGRRHPPAGGHAPRGQGVERIERGEALRDGGRVVVTPLQRAAEGLRAER